MLAPDAANICEQTARALRNTQACELGYELDGLADDGRIERALRRGDNFCKLVCFRRREEMSALRSKLFAHRLFDRRVNDHRLLRSADRSVVKTRARQDVLHSFRRVRRALDEDRDVARSNAEPRLAG